jgi:hypothetical protein
MVKLEEVEDEELNQPQNGPVIASDDEWTDDGMFPLITTVFGY